MTNKKGWFYRQEVQKVTLDWLRTRYHPTSRELELLKIINERKLVSREHLEIISPSYRNIPSRTRILNRAIKKMFDVSVLDKAIEKQEIGKGNKSCILCLDRGGSTLLNIPHKKRLIHNKKIVKGQEFIFRELPANYRHINGVNQLEVETIQYCEQTRNEIVEWLLEQNTTFFYGKETITVVTDVIVDLKINDKHFLVFLEYDTGSENRGYKNEFPIIGEKLVKYRKYYLSKLWEEKYKTFPFVLLVTEDEKRIKYFNQRCEKLKLKGKGVYYKNYTNFLKNIKLKTH